jgi:Chitobiase/beta-hexosaminidase C-terminal domain
LDLSRMPLKDEELKVIAQFSQLQKLILNFTSITGATFGELQSLKKLRVLSIAGTAVKKEQLLALEKLPSLQRLIIWNTAITPDEMEVLKKKRGPFSYETGFRSDTMVMRLSPPIFQNEEQVISGTVPLKLKHYINGAIIRYTTDGTEPDSVTSPIYTDKAVIDRNMWIKTKAFKSGWLSSEIAQQYFFRTGYIPDSVILLTPPDPKYVSERGRTLNNQIKGDLNFASGKWLGYRENRMEALLYLKKAEPIKSITVSYLKLVGSYIVPPQSVEIWGGTEPGQLKLLGKVNPEQPTQIDAGLVLPVEVKTDGKPIRYIKVIMTPVFKLPSWHPGKGEKGWAFVDEILLN